MELEAANNAILISFLGCQQYVHKKFRNVNIKKRQNTKSKIRKNKKQNNNTILSHPPSPPPLLIPGHYAFINAETGSAYLTTNDIPADTDRCLRFWFSFGGSDAGTLNVYAQTTGRGQALWTLGSWASFGWNVAEVNLPAGKTPYKVKTYKNKSRIA